MAYVDPATQADGDAITATLWNILVNSIKALKVLVDALTPYTASVTTTYTVNATNGRDQTIECSGTFTVTLFAAAAHAGYRVRIKNIGTGVITVDGNGSETIDGALTATIDQQYASLSIEVNPGATAWSIH